MKSRKFIANSFTHIVLAALSVVWLLPIVFAVLTSFREESGSYKTYIMPKAFTLANYAGLFEGNYNYGAWFMNTLTVAIFTCVISTFFVLSVAYSLSRLRFSGRKTLLTTAMVLGMFPGFMSMVAVYYILKSFGMLEAGQLKLLALILVYSAASGLTFYIAKGFFDTLPKALDEAAYLDGATKWQTFTQVIMPLSKPILVYTMIQSFMVPWTDFIFARVILGQDRDYFTVAVGLWSMLEKENINYYYTRFFAGSVLISIPMAALFMVTQKFYAESVGGAVKG